MSLLLLFRPTRPYVPTGIGRARLAAPGRLAVVAATRHTATASARPAGSLAVRRNTQGRTR